MSTITSRNGKFAIKFEDSASEIDHPLKPHDYGGNGHWLLDYTAVGTIIFAFRGTVFELKFGNFGVLVLISLLLLEGFENFFFESILRLFFTLLLRLVDIVYLTELILNLIVILEDVMIHIRG